LVYSLYFRAPFDCHLFKYFAFIKLLDTTEYTDSHWILLIVFMVIIIYNSFAQISVMTP